VMSCFETSRCDSLFDVSDGLATILKH